MHFLVAEPAVTFEVDLAPGINEIEVVAIDASGTDSSVLLRPTLDTSQPPPAVMGNVLYAVKDGADLTFHWTAAAANAQATELFRSENSELTTPELIVTRAASNDRATVERGFRSRFSSGCAVATVPERPVRCSSSTQGTRSLGRWIDRSSGRPFICNTGGP